MTNQKKLDKLLSSVVNGMKRDIAYILQEGRSQKLSPHSAKDLATYARLLSEISAEVDKARTKTTKAVNKMTNDELRAEAEKLLEQKD